MTTFMEHIHNPLPDIAPMPHDESGDFLFEDEEFFEPTVYETTRRSRIKTLYENDTATITQRTLMTEDGRKYIVSSSQLAPGRETLPTQYIETTAFMTQPDGMYTRRLINLARLGIEGTVVSSPQNIGILSSLEHNGRNVLSIAQHEATRRDLDSRFMVVGGESRGSMTGVAMARFAEEYGITPLFAHLDAPCVPRGLAEAYQESIIEHGSLGGTRKMATHVVKAVVQEFKTLNKAMDNDRAANRHLGKTLDTSRRAPIIHAQEAISLLSGDAGEHALYLPGSTFAHVGLANDDALSNPSRWVELLREYPGITTKVELSGGHLSTIGRVFHEGWLGNMTVCRDVIAAHPELTSRSAHDDPTATAIEFSQYFAHADPSYKPLPHLPRSAA